MMDNVVRERRWDLHGKSYECQKCGEVYVVKATQELLGCPKCDMKKELAIEELTKDEDEVDCENDDTPDESK